MRFLNKVVFINSATIPYAEVMVDGNVHLIGTQGVGKSTLLRAILFFYNADTLKLGISKEKKNFAEYYFPFQNSYLVYEVHRENSPFCILAFKSQGKVCFRFIDGAYRREFYVSPGGRAFEKWEDIRRLLDTERIDNSRKIDRYEEYRDILYGNSETGKKEFVKYALLQSKQYQNIPRTIQNVFLNSKLEAEFIKQTIIMSLNEEEISIDLQSYTHHLKNFENQLNDIHLYKQPHIVKQGENVVKNHLAIKHLENEKNKFALQLAWSAAQVKRTIPKLVEKKEKLEAEKESLVEKSNTADQRFRSRSEKIRGEISVLENDIKKAKEKIEYYSARDIESIIEKISKRKELENELQKFTAQQQVLTSHFSEITLKFTSLFNGLEQAARSFEQNKKEDIVNFREQASTEKETARILQDKAVTAIRLQNKAALDQANLAVEQQQHLLQQERIKKATITHQRFFEKESGIAKDTEMQYKHSIRENENEMERLKMLLETLQKQWELDEQSEKQSTTRQQEQLKARITTDEEAIASITSKLENYEQALYGWLAKNKAGWEDTIGRTVSEQVLFNTALNPRAGKANNNLYGIEIDLRDIDVKVKTPALYQAECKGLQKSVAQQQKQLETLSKEQLQQLDKLKKKYQPQIKTTKDSLLETQYKQEQDTLRLQQVNLQVKDLEQKAKAARKEAIDSIDETIAKASEALVQAQQFAEQTQLELDKQLKSKEKEYAKKISAIDLFLSQQLAAINESLKVFKANWQEEEGELKKRRQQELSGKGADTKRLETIEAHIQRLQAALQFIEDNRDLAAEYKKDKKELIDKADTFKSQRNQLEKQYSTEADKYRLQKESTGNAIRECEERLQQVVHQLHQQEEDSIAFDRFRQTDSYLSLMPAYTEENDVYRNEKDCRTLIDEVNRCYYTAIKRMDDLKEAANKFLGNFSAQNIFQFPEILGDKHGYQQFAEELNEFINNSKIDEFEKRVNERFANVIKLVGKETGDLMSKTGDIQKVISNINKDFENKNFVGAIRKIELRIDESANKVVQLLQQVKKYNDEHSFDIGGLNLFSSTDQESKNKKAVDLLKQLSKAITEYRKDSIALSDSFELKFRVEENQNDTGWVEKLSNVGSEGTDVLVKAMINIMLLNVFKEGASKRFKEFRLHCMMDEIGKLHPNNIKGILQFANDRNILLINGSPTENNALNYRHIYKLEKDAKRNTRIKRIISHLVTA
ncbi:MAG: hypothetical protein JWP81_961 [Ferruginibacter sp.]|nr:hypothetical protein [Ferruginibacter sp.]